jgi:beta-glucanase (GH16 family)
MTVHGGRDEGPNHDQDQAYARLGDEFYNQFHTYGLDWRRDKLVYYIDGLEVFETDFVPNDDFFILIGVGPEPTLISRPETQSLTHEIEYIRVFSEE